MTRVALIADPHVHDCGWSPSGSGLQRAVRSYAETSASTRVFNESLPDLKSVKTEYSLGNAQPDSADRAQTIIEDLNP